MRLTYITQNTLFSFTVEKYYEKNHFNYVDSNYTFTMSKNVLAKDNINYNFKTKEGDIFAEYDVATGETTYFSVSEYNCGY